jgi:hypothetical protein
MCMGTCEANGTRFCWNPAKELLSSDISPDSGSQPVLSRFWFQRLARLYLYDRVDHWLHPVSLAMEAEALAESHGPIRIFGCVWEHVRPTERGSAGTLRTSCYLRISALTLGASRYYPDFGSSV